MYSSLSSYEFPICFCWILKHGTLKDPLHNKRLDEQNKITKENKKNSRHCLLKYTDLWTVESVLSSRLVQQVKEPLDGRREVGRHFQDRPKEVVHKLLDRPLRGEQPGQEDLRDGLVGARR